MGALSGFRIIELAGIGPAPMGCMMLADMGAEVIRVERPGGNALYLDPVSARGKKSVSLNLKAKAGVDAFLQLVDSADVLVEAYRPGVAEKLGVGPDACRKRNPKLVYARMTGWGQEGPLAQTPGHDINYIALTGALHAVGRRGEKPVPPLNLVGDMGGGGMLLVNGVLAALLEAQGSGEGQVLDVAMIDGTAQLMWMTQGMQQIGAWDDTERGVNLLDGCAHFYDTYETADGKYICVGAIESQFYAKLVELAGVDPELFKDQHDSARWPELTERLAEVFLSKTRDQWCEIMEGSEACFSPVLTLSEAPDHPANRMRSSYIQVDGITQHAPAPRFSRTPSEVKHGVRPAGADTTAVLAAAGVSSNDIAGMIDAGVAAQTNE
ncbi:alpha-methylacyl-CoA racemase [Luminiphilus syltensis NOR5-1B]|uniref:Alpha-methylacyl-CoA racemase n=1 Tax=Luminiphilus syltensis NOR5-1B TaxID=565045 RepID=B8KQZ5_9GAMM|nr:CaiB/BaiF CoA-transferase family protein [Luminiphilus syltensis]EED34891.1 alpha-methylacyl-CoA racemase [Luminiphilus syltensis NOR5-1B]